VGRWECPEGECEPVCDFTTCGDDSCAGNEGTACRSDCTQGYCSQDADCIVNGWGQLCEGYWDCVIAGSVSTCVSRCGGSCGDDECDLWAGESGWTCPSDCRAGPCPYGVMDCFLIGWDDPVGTDCSGVGVWSCSGSAAGSSCDRVCDDANAHCPDGTCDVRGGESPDSCPDDCSGYTCQTAADCDDLSLPDGCSGGTWYCYQRVCWPEC